MGWFKKKGEVIDLTYLAKRGLIKKEDYKDLTKSNSQEMPVADSSALGFLGTMAASSEPVSESSKKPSSSQSQNKIEDIEYKLEVVSKRVNALLDRLDLVEKKLARDLRQGNS
jgi:phage shock protein A